MKVYEPDSLSELRHQLFETNYIEKDNGKIFAHYKIFRGQKDLKWTLQSKFERFCDYCNQTQNTFSRINLKKSNGPDWYDKECNNILSRFKFNLNKLSEDYESINNYDAWILGRHHGLVTPFLDWTTNPMKALFFALEDIYKSLELQLNLPTHMEPVAVYKLNCWKDLFKENEFEHVGTVNPIGSRMNAQSCCFTYLKHKTFIRVEDYLESCNKSDYLEKFIIKEGLINDILLYLHEMEIDAFSMYPDLTGAALQANINMDNIYGLNSMIKK